MRNGTDEEAGCSPAKKRERDAVAEEPLRRVKTEGKQFLTIFKLKKENSNCFYILVFDIQNSDEVETEKWDSDDTGEEDEDKGEVVVPVAGAAVPTFGSAVLYGPKDEVIVRRNGSTVYHRYHLAQSQHLYFAELWPEVLQAPPVLQPVFGEVATGYEPDVPSEKQSEVQPHQRIAEARESQAHSGIAKEVRHGYPTRHSERLRLQLLNKIRK